MKKPFFRKKILTGDPVQRKYIGLLLLSMLVPSVLVGACLYFLIFNIMAEQLGIPEYVAMNLVPVIKKINVILLASFLPLLSLIFVWGVILSNRFAGPLQRLKREIDEISHSEDYARRLKVRKHDDLRPITDAINKLLNKVSGGKVK